jgi:hypothetical protein
MAPSTSLATRFTFIFPLIYTHHHRQISWIICFLNSNSMQTHSLYYNVNHSWSSPLTHLWGMLFIKSRSVHFSDFPWNLFNPDSISIYYNNILLSYSNCVCYVRVNGKMAMILSKCCLLPAEIWNGVLSTAGYLFESIPESSNSKYPLPLCNIMIVD